MSNSKEFAVILFLVIASFATGTHGSSPPVTAVTLWQFGQNRLLGGAVTVPLQPLGTASDGSATTYRYEVANNNVVASTDSAGSITIQTTAVPTSRTIVASASGWVEEFGNGVEIVCGFVDSEFGACLDTTVSGSGSTANSGVPTPVALQVALVASPTIVPQTTTPTQITSTPAPNEQPLPPPVGPIIGDLVIALVALFIGVAFVLYRRRLRRIKPKLVSISPAQTPANTPFNGASGIPPLSFDAAPQIEAATLWPRTTSLGPWKNLRGEVEWPQAVAVPVQYTSDADAGDETTDYATSPQGSESVQPSMAEIVDRVRRLEVE